MHFKFAKIFYGYVMPIVACITITGNIFVLCVYFRQCFGGTRAKKASNTFLISISVSYILVPLLPLPWYIYAFLFNNWRFEATQELCYVWYLFEMLPIIPHNGAVLLTCALTIQRYTAMKYPLKANVWWSYRKALVIVFAIYIIDLAIHSIGILGIKMNSSKDNASTIMNNGSLLTYESCDDYFINQDWINDNKTFEITWTLARICITGVMPSIVLLSTVVATTNLLRKRSSKREENGFIPSDVNTDENTKTENYKQKVRRIRNHFKTPTRVIVFIAMTSVLVEIFISILLIIYAIAVASENVSLTRSVWNSIGRPITSICLFVGANVVFLYSCFLNRRFRVTMQQFFKCYKRDAT